MSCPYRKCTAELRCHGCLIGEMAAERAEHESRVHSGLEDARGALSEIWRRHAGAGNDSLRDLTSNALGAVIEAEAALRAADAFIAAPTKANRDKLQQVCATRAMPARLMRKP